MNIQYISNNILTKSITICGKAEILRAGMKILNETVE